MFQKGNQLAKRCKGIKRSDDPTVLSHWLKRFKVDLNALTTIQRAELAIEAWKVSIKKPSSKADRVTRQDDAQRLINALENSASPIALRDGAEPLAIPTPPGE